MEHTLFESFCMTNNLRSLISAPSSSDVLQELSSLFDQNFAGDPRNPVPTLSDMGPSADDSVVLDFEQVSPLPALIYRALFRRLSFDLVLAQSVVYRRSDSTADMSTPILNPNAQFLSAVMHRGRRYTDAAHNVGDSQVTYFRHVTPALSSPAYGQIQAIFVHQRAVPGGCFRNQVFAAIRAFRELGPVDASTDPYRIHRGLGAKLMVADLDTTTEVLPMEDVRGHFVSCLYDHPQAGPVDVNTPRTSLASRMVVVDLGGVSSSIISCMSNALTRPHCGV
ncbi:hypothetical protein C2E23DRAFT_722656 [Lenzites betulinus]|nr:hypothetical protein C2E23DRAFT_722656 [Lenzites betulinus]